MAFPTHFVLVVRHPSSLISVEPPTMLRMLRVGRICLWEFVRLISKDPDQPACVWIAVGAAHKTAISVAVRLLMVMEGCFGFWGGSRKQLVLFACFISQNSSVDCFNKLWDEQWKKFSNSFYRILNFLG